MRALQTGSALSVRIDAAAAFLALAATIAAVLALGAVACDRPTDAPWLATVDTLASGVVVVRNPEAGRWSREPGWRLEGDLCIGRLDGEGPDVFGEPVAVAVDGAGRIYVLDRQAAEVRVFDAGGSPIRVLGGRGGGPGELANPTGLAWDPDGRLWVLDPGNARFTAYDTAGLYQASAPRGTPGVVLPWPGLMDDEGRMLDVGLARDPDVGVRTTLVRYRPGFVGLDTLPLPEYEADRFEGTRESDRGVSYFMADIPYAPTLTWALDPRGYLWHGITVPYRIVQSTFDGDTVRVIERVYTPEPVTPADRAGAMAMLQPLADMGLALDPARVPDRKPAYEAFFTDDEGRLWVALPRTLPGDDAPPTITAMDVFDPDGQYLGRLDLDPPLLPGTAVVRGGALYGIHQADPGVPTVVRLTILRP
jgi:hypothetical protein